MNWADLDWEILDRLRETFLTDRKSAGPYWHTLTDLECYDLTFGERIGWKWDAVLAELKGRGWSPPAGGTVLDWGCGSGVAARRVIGAFGAAHFASLRVHDHSELAMEFAAHHGRKKFPQLTIDRTDVRWLRGSESIGVLVLSHVLNELDEVARAELTDLCNRAETIVWVEPGMHDVSRELGAWREKLRATGWRAVAPCPHAGACGVLTPGNERHWCHFFATPPANLFADSDWVKFGQRAGIDLRSLPYSFLALDRRPDPAVAATISSPAAPHPCRIIGEPRMYKGYAKIFNCDAWGVQELMLQKRDDPALFKQLQRAGADTGLHQWSHHEGRVKTSPPESSAPDSV
jgi:hypothetical protein